MYIYIGFEAILEMKITIQLRIIILFLIIIRTTNKFKRHVKIYLKQINHEKKHKQYSTLKEIIAIKQFDTRGKINLILLIFCLISLHLILYILEEQLELHICKSLILKTSNYRQFSRNMFC